MSKDDLIRRSTNDDRISTVQQSAAVETTIVQLFDEKDPIVLESGQSLAPVSVAYETYGRLSSKNSS